MENIIGTFPWELGIIHSNNAVKMKHQLLAVYWKLVRGLTLSQKYGPKNVLENSCWNMYWVLTMIGSSQNSRASALDKLSTTVAVLTRIGIPAHGNILRIWAELCVDFNPDEMWEEQRGPHSLMICVQEAFPVYSDLHISELWAFFSLLHYSTGQTIIYQVLSGAQHCCLM